jgi:ribosome-binding protein aMBF1 (putative translation factor)
MINILKKMQLLKKCELCHKYIATRRVITFANKKICVCDKCYKIVKF